MSCDVATCGKWFVRTLLASTWFLLSAPAARAQTSDDWQVYANSMKALGKASNAGRWDETAQIAEQLQAYLVQRVPRIEHFATVWVAMARHGQTRYRESLALYQQSLQQCQNFQPQTVYDRTINTITTGEALRGVGISMKGLGDARGAIPYLEAAVKWYRDNNQAVSAAETQKDLGNMLFDMADFKGAEKHLRVVIAAMEPIARNERPAGNATFILGHSLACWAGVQVQVGRFDLAEPALQRALQLIIATRTWKHSIVGEIFNNLGLAYLGQNRYGEADESFRSALYVSENTDGPNHHRTTYAMMNVAGIMSHQGKYAEAEALCRRALAIRQEQLGPEHMETANALSRLGKNLSDQDKFAEAEVEHLKSNAIYEKVLGPDSAYVAEGLLNVAMCRSLQGRQEEGLAALAKVEAHHKKTPLSPQSVVAVHGLRATMLYLSDRKPEALIELEKALDMEESSRAFTSGAERERATMMQRIGVIWESAIHWQAELKNVDKMFSAMERIKARSFLDELRFRSVDLFVGLSPAQRKQLADRETELRRQLSEAERLLEALPPSGREPTPQAKAEQDKRIAAVVEARDALYRFLNEARSSSPVYRELLTNKTQPVSLEQMQQRLGDEELLLTYSVGDYHTYVIAVRKTGTAFTELKIDEPSSKLFGVPRGDMTQQTVSRMLLDEQQGVLSKVVNGPQTDRDPTAQLAALWQLLIPEAERTAITEGKVKLLTVLPDGALALLPFESLVVTPGDDAKYLLDVGPPILYAPSGAVLLNLAERQTKALSSQQAIFTLGDPIYQQVAAPKGAEGAVRAGDRFRAGLVRLPYTGWESTWVQQMFDKAGLSTVKVAGQQATEAAIRQYAPDREIIHLACHGMADQSYGNFFGALAVAPGKAGDPRDDGFLSMSEIYELKLDACELAILSACETNYGPQQQGEGVWALSRGFLVAGARRVIASNWVVDDQAGATLVSYFATYLTRDGKDASARDYAQALHEAKKQIRKEEKWAHPFYWSSLVLVGPK